VTLASTLLPPGVATLLAAAALSIVVVGVVARVARARQAFDRPSARRSHTVPTPRLGGVGLWVAFLGARLFEARGPAAGALEWGCTAFFLLGFVDDLRVGGHGLPARVKLAGQVACALLPVALGLRFAGAGSGPFGPLDFGLLEAPMTVLWLLAVANLVNFTDGLDAIAGTTCAVAFGLALGVAGGAEVGEGAAVWGAALGAVLGFLAWNAPPARIFMGDGGSHALGFLVAATVCRVDVAGLEGAALRPVPWALLGGALVPSIVDVGEALLHKGRHGIPMSLAHNDHLYQRLHKSGLSQTAVALRYGALAVAGAAVAGPLASAAGLAVALPVGAAILGAHLVDGARRTRGIPRLEAP